MDADTKGDLFEHVLRQIRQAGELGQFRTPRHVIRAMVRLVAPRLGETVYDPAAGTAGFLVGAYDHIRLANSSPDGIEEAEADGQTIRRGLDRVRIKHLHIQAAKTAAAATASLMTRSAPADSDRIKADVVYRFRVIRAGSRS